MALKNKSVTLCGGTFFTLLVEAKTPVADAHEKEKGVSYDNSDDDIFKALIQVPYSDFKIEEEKKASFHTTTNNYKKCKCEAAKAWPMSKSTEELEDATDNYVYLKGMHNFLNKYILRKKRPQLINQLMDLILNDNSVAERKWRISENEYTTADKFCSCDVIYADYFLWDVWKYIIVSAVKNKPNEELYDAWFETLDSYKDESQLKISDAQIELSEFDEEMPETEEVNNTEENEDEATEDVADEVPEEPIKSSHDIITEQMCKSAQVVADVLEAYFDNVANTITQRNQAAEAPERIDVLYESSMMKGKLWQRIKSGDIKPLQYSNAKEINQYAMNEYYEFSESCSLKTRYIDGAKMVEVKIPSQGFDIIGYTTGSNWKSESAKNRAIKHGTHIFKGIFKVEAVEEDSISVQYLYLGEEV